MLHNVSPDQLTAIAKNFKIELDYAHALASAEHEFAPGDRKWKRLTEKLSAIQKRTLPSLSMAEQGHVGRLSANDIVTSLLAAKKELHNSMAPLKWQAFLDEAALDAEQAAKNIEWIKALPVYLELDGLRFVHALWDQPAIDFLHREGLLRDDHTVQPDRWNELARKYTPGCDAIELLTKGVEVPLPPGVRFFDADGIRRNKARLKWWANPGDPNLKLADVILDVPHEVIPNIPAPEDIRARMREVQQLEDNTVFFGHYWQRGEHPTVESPHAICVDQSVAKDGSVAIMSVKLSSRRDFSEQRRAFGHLFPSAAGLFG